MLCEIVCAIVSATLLAACWVPCCLVIWGCAEPQVSLKTVQIPFYYISAKTKETGESPPPLPPQPPPPSPSPQSQPPPSHSFSPTPTPTPQTMGSLMESYESYDEDNDDNISIRQHFKRRTRRPLPGNKGRSYKGSLTGGSIKNIFSTSVLSSLVLHYVSIHLLY